MEELKEKIEQILKDTLPAGCYIEVFKRKLLGTDSLGIFFAANSYNISGVADQKPQAVSLRLDFPSLELMVQVWGGMGGQRVYRQPNRELPEEKWLAMKGVKVPFRKPKNEEKAVLAAIKRFAENWIKTIQENREVLMYQDVADYSIF